MSLWIRNPTKSQSGRSQVRTPVLKRDASVMLKTVFSVLSYSVSLDSLEPKKMLNSLYFMCQGQLWVCRCRSRWPRNKEELRGGFYSQSFTEPQGMANTRWDFSDLFGVSTLPYGFRQNWNAKQNSKSFKAVNENWQIFVVATMR